MSAMMSDVIEGALTPGVINAAVNAGGKLLKVVDLQMKYGTTAPGSGAKQLVLCQDAGDGERDSPDMVKEKFAAMRAELDALEKQELGN